MCPKNACDGGPSFTAVPVVYPDSEWPAQYKALGLSTIYCNSAAAILSLSFSWTSHPRPPSPPFKRSGHYIRRERKTGFKCISFVRVGTHCSSPVRDLCLHRLHARSVSFSVVPPMTTLRRLAYPITGGIAPPLPTPSSPPVCAPFLALALTNVDPDVHPLARVRVRVRSR